MSRPRVDALVIGAGAAGLAAAREISQAGLAATVIEARDRIGGRIFTVHDAHWPLPIELGAEFVHGEPPATFEIIRSAGLLVNELPAAHYRSRAGKLSPMPEFWQELYELRQGIGRSRERRKHDFSLADYLKHAKLAGERRHTLVNFVEGYDAADPEKISAEFLAPEDEERNSGNKQFRMASGYDALVHWLRAGLDPERMEIRLNTVATRLQWKRGQVTLECVSRTGATLEPFRAKAAVVALPHAVLKAKALVFQPDLPNMAKAAEKLEAGQVFKVVLRFRTIFWEEKGFVKKHVAQKSPGASQISFIYSNESDIPVWWTASPTPTPMLTAWAGGPRAEKLLSYSEDMRLDKTLDALAIVFGIPRRVVDENLESWSAHDWQADPFSRAAYTYVGVGGISAPAEIAKPVQQTIFFAGEATDLEEMGTVAGALTSGQRAAKQLIQCLQ